MKGSLQKLLFCFYVMGAGEAATLFGPSLYFSERDSPWFSGIVDNAGNGIWLEDFEDGELNTPNVQAVTRFGDEASTFRSSFNNPGPTAIWGVDGDDGALNGSGYGGDVWIVTTNAGGPRDQMIFQFLPDSQGRLPTYVGFVIARFSGGNSSAEVDWLDADGKTIHDDFYRTRDWALDPVTQEPMEGLFGGDARLHRFVGIYHEDGIAELHLEKVNQLDHLQYGYSIPELSKGLLLLLAGLRCVVTRRRN
ncbi:MAG: hypothetical protein ACN4GG_09155 [Akkermansiaceae bacterium]